MRSGKADDMLLNRALMLESLLALKRQDAVGTIIEAVMDLQEHYAAALGAAILDKTALRLWQEGVREALGIEGDVPLNVVVARIREMRACDEAQIELALEMP
jgi:hypothetical protein